MFLCSFKKFSCRSSMDGLCRGFKSLPLFRKIYLLFLFIPLVCGSIIIVYDKAFEAKIAQEASPCRSTAYTIRSATGEKVGYIIGTFHQGVTESQLSQWQKNISNLADSVSELYLEVPIPVTYPIGAERKLMEIVTEQEIARGHVIKVDALETIEGQTGLITNIQGLGPYSYRLPFSLKYTYNHPSLVEKISMWFRIANAPFNIIYNTVCPETQQAMLKLGKNETANQLKLFLQGKCQITSPEINSIHEKFLKLTERDKLMFDNFMSKHSEFSQDNLFMICIGAAHLANQKGILNQFEKAGFTLEPINVTLVD